MRVTVEQIDRQCEEELIVRCYVDDADVEAFDRQFPPKEKMKLPGQLFD